VRRPREGKATLHGYHSSIGRQSYCDLELSSAEMPKFASLQREELKELRKVAVVFVDLD